MNKLNYRFDSYVIPSHFEDHNKYQHLETVHYWMVTFTLKSGEVKQFYVKARTYEDALIKANSYKYLVEMNLIREFKLLP